MQTLRSAKVLFFVLLCACLCACAGFSGREHHDESSTAGAPLAKFGELSSLATETDKGPSGHNYTEVYEYFFLPLKYAPIRILEIGIEEGGSLRLWEKYFPNAAIFGIDIVNKEYMNSKRLKTFVGDQASRQALSSFIEKSGGDFDIIIDDGGHTMEQQQISLGFLFKYLKPGGLYVLEDLHTSLPEFFPGYGVDAFNRNSSLFMIYYYINNKKMSSEYLTPEENLYLSRNIEYTNVHQRAHGETKNRPSITCIFKKKG